MNKDLFSKMDDKDSQNNSFEESIFEYALKCLNNNDVKGFSENIIELHRILQCDCFFLKKDKEVYKNLWDKLDSQEDNYEDFHLSYAKYFAYKWSRDFLPTRSINLYRAALRYGNEIDTIILFCGGKNEYAVKIAEKNIEANKEAKDYYFLARRSGDYSISKRKEEMVEKTVESYNKVLELDPTHCCARYQKCMFLLKVIKKFSVDCKEDQLSTVLMDFNICINAKISHQQFFLFILEILSIELKINGKKSIPHQYLFYLNYGQKIYPDKKIYSYLLGIRWLYKGKLEDALQLFYSQGRLEDFNENEEGYENDHLYTILERSLSFALKKMYFSKSYNNVLKLSKCYIFLLGEYSYPQYTLLTYLKLKDETIKISNENQIYIDLKDRLENDIQIYDLSSEFSFGKNKGQTIGQVLDMDPSYLLWCLINVDWFVLSHNIFTNNWESLKDCPSIYRALEYLLIKSLIAIEEDKRKQAEYERKQEEYDSDRFDAREKYNHAFLLLNEEDYGPYKKEPSDWQERYE